MRAAHAPVLDARQFAVTRAADAPAARYRLFTSNACPTPTFSQRTKNNMLRSPSARMAHRRPDGRRLPVCQAAAFQALPRLQESGGASNIKSEGAAPAVACCASARVAGRRRRPARAHEPLSFSAPGSVMKALGAACQKKQASAAARAAAVRACASHLQWHAIIAPPAHDNMSA